MSALDGRRSIRRRIRAWIGDGWIGTTALIAGALCWELVGQLADYRFLPPLSSVSARLVEMLVDGSLLDSLGESLVNLAIGFGLAVAIGIPTGLAMGVHRKTNLALSPYIYLLITTPSIVFAPIFFSIFGLGRAPIVAVIVMFAVFQIIVNTETGVRTVPRELIDMARSFNARRRHLFVRVLLPGAAPLILAAVRVGVATSVQGMVNAEMFIAVIGLGNTVITAGRRFDSEAVLAVLLVLIALAIVLSRIVRILEVRFLRHLLPESSSSGRRSTPRGRTATTVRIGW